MSTWLLSFLSRRSYIVWRFRSGMWNDHPSHQSQKLFPGTEYVKKTGKYKERTILNGEHLSKQFCLKRKVSDDISYSMKPHISIFRFHVWLMSNHIEDMIFPPGGLIAISPSRSSPYHHKDLTMHCNWSWSLPHLPSSQVRVNNFSDSAYSSTPVDAEILDEHESWSCLFLILYFNCHVRHRTPYPIAIESRQYVSQKYKITCKR